nr:hypothetical protein [uncultured Friedmanniella sp.]
MTSRESEWDDLAFDEGGRLIDVGGPLEFASFGPPPPVTWVAVMDLAEVFGRRAAVVNSRGPAYDLRLASDAFEDAGGWYIHLVGEDQWWEWLSMPEQQRPPRPTRAVCWPTRYVWVENRGR